MYIKRAMEDVILRANQTFKAVLITGARQTGKSTILQQMFPDRKMITFYDSYLESQARNNPDMFMQLNAPPITIDEVQYVPELFRYTFPQTLMTARNPNPYMDERLVNYAFVYGFKLEMEVYTLFHKQFLALLKK